MSPVSPVFNAEETVIFTSTLCQSSYCLTYLDQGVSQAAAYKSVRVGVTSLLNNGVIHKLMNSWVRQGAKSGIMQIFIPIILIQPM